MTTQYYFFPLFLFPWSFCSIFVAQGLVVTPFIYFFLFRTSSTDCRFKQGRKDGSKTNPKENTGMRTKTSHTSVHSVFRLLDDFRVPPCHWPKKVPTETVAFEEEKRRQSVVRWEALPLFKWAQAGLLPARCLVWKDSEKQKRSQPLGGEFFQIDNTNNKNNDNKQQQLNEQTLGDKSHVGWLAGSFLLLETWSVPSWGLMGTWWQKTSSFAGDAKPSDVAVLGEDRLDSSKKRAFCLKIGATIVQIALFSSIKNPDQQQDSIEIPRLLGIWYSISAPHPPTGFTEVKHLTGPTSTSASRTR